MKRSQANLANISSNPIQQEFFEDVIEGLSKYPKSLPSKYFYDESGSRLFEEICALEEYYLTRMEVALLQSIRGQLASLIGPNAAIIEPGAGAGIKIQILLETLHAPALYAPLDISEDFLIESSQRMQQRFPRLRILPISGDFTQPRDWPRMANTDRRIVFFPGSTLGNFAAPEAVSFLKNMRTLCGNRGAMILGVDMVKEVEILEAAYNDKNGVTAAFNKNLLLRINHELGGDFNPERFAHKAFFNPRDSRIEMHLESRIEHHVKIGGRAFLIRQSERIHTENSHKFTLESIHALTQQAGFGCRTHWMDDKKYFSIHFLEPIPI